MPDRDIYADRIVYVNAWEQVRRRVCAVETFHHVHEYIVPFEFIRPQVMTVGIDGGNNQKNRHTDK